MELRTTMGGWGRRKQEEIVCQGKSKNFSSFQATFFKTKEPQAHPHVHPHIFSLYNQLPRELVYLCLRADYTYTIYIESTTYT